MEWLALALFAGYAVVGFGLRAVLQRRRTGDSGFRGLSGPPGSPEWWAGVLFGTALAAGVLGPVAGLVGLTAFPVPSWLRAGGALLAMVGIVATFVTQLAMGENWRVGVDQDERTDLVTTGPFASVRNPIFTAMLVTGAGLALVVPNVVSLLGWLLLIIAIEVQVRVVEEPYLARLHGQAYAVYRSTVSRFVPGVGRR